MSFEPREAEDEVIVELLEDKTSCGNGSVIRLVVAAFDGVKHLIGVEKSSADPAATHSPVSIAHLLAARESLWSKGEGLQVPSDEKWHRALLLQAGLL